MVTTKRKTNGKDNKKELIQDLEHQEKRTQGQ